jgi:hypothetical protein
MQIKLRTIALSGAIVMACAASLRAQPVGQWDFNSGTLAGTVGAALEYIDGPGGPTQQGTQFGTTTSFGIPDIGGTVANVVRVPKATDATMGLVMPVAAAANGGGTLVNSYTLIFELLFPAGSHSKWRGLLDADKGAIEADAEFFVNTANGIGISGNYSGNIQSNRWYRIGLVMDGDTKTMRKYIDGVLVGSQSIPNIDDRFALSPAGTAYLFTDNDGETEIAYVNSIQLRDRALTTPEMRAMGGPLAAGIQQTIPPVPSGIDRFIPATAFSSRNTEVGAVIDTGSTTIQDASISVRLNGTAVANPTISRSGGLITVRSGVQNLTPGNKYTNLVSYTDSLNGAQSFTNVFTAALFYEDFDEIPLGPNIEESSAGEHVWTNTPPSGWLIDNSNMAGRDSPDDDGDGRPDNDGRSEWAGWAFADRTWWPTVDDQTRSQFTRASGTVAIADPDEWDDAYSDPTVYGGGPGLFNSLLTTPEISLAGIAANTLSLRFDSSWRPEAEDDGAPKFPVNAAGSPTNNQTAVITVSYDGGAPVQILKFDSKSGSPTYHPDSQNESVSIPLNNPAGAQRMKITFAMLYAANDWWWAVDNIVVNAGASPPSITKQPAGGLFSAGGQVTLSVDIAGSEPFTFQWKRNGADIAGATGRTLTLNDLQAANAGVYTVVVSNSAGSTTSEGAAVALFSGAITNDLVLHLKMDGNLTDSSGKGNNGTPVGAPTFEAGKIGNAVHIPSGTDYVTLGAPVDLNFGTATDFSIAFWAKVNAFGGDASLIANKDWDSGGNQGYVIFTDSNRRVDWNLAGAPGGRKDGDQVPNAFPSNQWAHVVLTFDRDGLAVTYTNGVRVLGSSMAADANNLDTPDGFATNLGQDGAGDYGSVFTDLSIDDLGIWRRVLTVQEVAAIYAAGIAGRDLSTAAVGGGGGNVRITGIQRSDANLAITVSGTGNLQLQKKALLSDASWSPVAATAVNGVFTVPVQGTTGFFRVASQ